MGDDQEKPVVTIEQSEEIPAPPHDVYDALIDGETHARFTGSPAMSDPRVGGKMTAHGEYISGKYLELDRPRRIVQTWRTSEWPDGYDDSQLDISLSPSAKGTLLRMVHTKVPASLAPNYDSGWKEHYWQPLREHFEGG